LDTSSTPATPEHRNPSTSKWSLWGRRVFKGLRLAYWGYKLWEFGHKFGPFFQDPNSWGSQLLAFLQELWKGLM
jgi:hypothetical protein